MTESMSVEVSRLIFYDFVTGYCGTRFYVPYDHPVVFWQWFASWLCSSSALRGFVHLCLLHVA